MLTYCVKEGEKLANSNRDKAAESAMNIISYPDEVNISESDIPYFMDLLHSEKSLIITAAEIGLSHFPDMVYPLLINRITNKDYYETLFLSNIDKTLDLTNYTTDPLIKTLALCDIADAIFPYNKQQSVDLLNSAVSLSNEFEDDSELAKAYGRISGSFATIDTGQSLAFFDLALDELNGYWQEDIKNDIYSEILPELAKLDYEAAEDTWAGILKKIKSYWGTETTSEAYKLVAVNLIDVNLTKAYSLAYYSIYNSSKNYNQAKEAAVAFMAVDEEKGENLFELAYSMAEAVSLRANRIPALAVVATAWAEYNPQKALSKLGDISEQDDLRSDLLTAVAKQYVNTDFERTRYYLELIIQDTNRIKAAAEVASIADSNAIKQMLSLTNLSTNNSDLLYAIAQTWSKTDVDSSLSIAGNLTLTEDERETLYSSLALTLETTNRDKSYTFFNVIYDTAVDESSESNFVARLDVMNEILSQVKTYSVYPIWDSVLLLADDFISTQNKIKATRNIAKHLALYDYEMAENYFGYLDSSAAYELIQYRLTNDLLKNEKETLILLEDTALTNMIKLITPGYSDNETLLSIINQFSNITEEKIASLDSLITDTNESIETRSLLIDLFSGNPGDNTLKIFLNILTNESESALHDAVFEASGHFAGSQVLSFRVANLGEMLTSKDNNTVVRVNCARLLGLSGDERAAEYLTQILDDKPDSTIIESAVIALSSLNITNENYAISKFLSYDSIYPTVAYELGKLGGYEYLTDAFSTYYWSDARRMSIVEALSLNTPESRKHPLLGFSGYLYENAIHAYQMKGYKCIAVPDMETGAEMGCDIFLEGTLYLEYTDTASYFDKNSPDGVAKVSTEFHKATIRLYSEEGWSLWSITASGWGSAYGQEEVELEEGLALQEIINLQAGIELRKNLRIKLANYNSTIPFNF